MTGAQRGQSNPRPGGTTRRNVGDLMVEITPQEHPAGWSYVRLVDRNGAPWFFAWLPDSDVLLEIVVQLERMRTFGDALREDES